jgi:general stress protein 26
MDTLQARVKLYDLLGRFDTTMMVTHAPSGPLDCRPMRIAASEIDSGGPLWFITSVEDHLPQELSGDARTLLVFQGEGHYIALWGRAVVLTDVALARKYWREEHRTWVPLGPDDPDLRLVKFIPHSAEFWSAATEDTVRYLFEAARARAAEADADAESVADDQSHGRTNLSKP